MDSNNGFSGDDLDSKTYAISGRIMLAAIIVLFTVVLFILGLHIYARCFWQRSLANRRRRGSSRRRRLEFAGDQDPLRLQRIGLEKSVIESLPVFFYRAEEHKDEGLECAVCLCEFEENEKGRLLPKCNHSFHTECIDMWFESHSTCPLCRTSAQPEAAPAADQVVVVVVGEPSGTTGEEQVPVLGSIAADGESVHSRSESRRESDLCDSCRHGEGGLLSPTYPTNVLFWGTQNRISLRPSSSVVGEQGTSSGKFVVEIPPRRFDSFTSPRDDQQYFSPGGQPSLKSPSSTRLRSIKRLLSRAGVPPSPGSAHTEQDGSAQC
uniref:RING-type E3 ubiquitin transferase n=1 Tax=Araucaria cunninghamii TaxID=56994 RepID=A0A0D6R4N4_ARACU